MTLGVMEAEKAFTWHYEPDRLTGKAACGETRGFLFTTFRANVNCKRCLRSMRKRQHVDRKSDRK